MFDATILIKTLMRPEKVVRLAQSIRTEYPSLPIVVVDDGPPELQAREPLAALGVRHESFAFDAGVGTCLNTAVRDWISTPYTILVDDDCRFEGTRLALWEPHLDRYDVIGGQVSSAHGGTPEGFVGRFEWEKRANGAVLHLRHYDMTAVAMARQPVPCDYCLNWFVARTESLRRCPWDERLKVCRHADWFLGAYMRGLRIAYHHGVIVRHYRHTDPPERPEYMHLRRGRYAHFLRLVETKWHLVRGGLRETEPARHGWCG